MAFNSSLFGNVYNDDFNKKLARLTPAGFQTGAAGQAQSFGAQQEAIKQQEAQANQLAQQKAAELKQELQAESNRQAGLQREAKADQLSASNAALEQKRFEQQNAIQQSQFANQMALQQQQEAARQAEQQYSLQAFQAGGGYGGGNQQRNQYVGNHFNDVVTGNSSGNALGESGKLGQALGGFWDYDRSTDSYHNSRASIGSFGDYNKQGQGVLSRAQVNEVLNAPFGTVFRPQAGGFGATDSGHWENGFYQSPVSVGSVQYGGGGGLSNGGGYRNGGYSNGGWDSSNGGGLNMTGYGGVDNATVNWALYT